MTTREDRDKAKSAREMLSKYFFSLSIATYTGAVMGTLASMLGLLKGTDLDSGVIGTVAIFVIGSILTVIFAVVGNKIIKGKEKYYNYDVSIMFCMVYTLGWCIPYLAIYPKGKKMVTGTLNVFLEY